MLQCALGNLDFLDFTIKEIETMRERINNENLCCIIHTELAEENTARYNYYNLTNYIEIFSYFYIVLYLLQELLFLLSSNTNSSLKISKVLFVSVYNSITLKDLLYFH